MSSGTVPSAGRRAWAFRRPYGLAELHVGTEASAAQRDVEAGLGILAELLGADLAGAVGRRRERAGIAALRIIRAADEGAEFGKLQREPAGAAGRARPRIAAVRARRKQMRRQQRVERIDHLGDFQILDLVDRADEVAPEIAQHVAPGDLVVGDEIELLLELGREIVFDISGEEAFQERDDDAAAVLRMQPPLVEPHISCGP